MCFHRFSDNRRPCLRPEEKEVKSDNRKYRNEKL